MTALKKIYAYIAFFTVGLGFIVSLMFILALILGGSAGESLALLSKEVMTWGIRLASISVLIGVVYIYISKEHSLTINSDKKELEDLEKNKIQSDVLLVERAN